MWGVVVAVVEVSPLRRLPLAQAPPRSPGCNGSQAGSAASRPCNAAESACARGAVTWTAALLLDLRRAAPPAGKAERKEHVLDERDALFVDLRHQHFAGASLKISSLLEEFQAKNKVRARHSGWRVSMMPAACMRACVPSLLRGVRRPPPRCCARRSPSQSRWARWTSAT